MLDNAIALAEKHPVRNVDLSIELNHAMRRTMSKTSKPIAIIRRAGREKRIARAGQETIEEAIVETYLTDASTRRIEGFAESKG